MKIAAALVLACLLSAACSKAGSTSERDVEPARFAELIESENAVLVDVRTPAEIAQGKIEGAREIDFNAPDFSTAALRLPKDKTLLLYCRSGNRSGQAADFLQSAGYPNVVHLDGGIIAWKEQGYPLTEPK